MGADATVLRDETEAYDDGTPLSLKQADLGRRSLSGRSAVGRADRGESRGITAPPGRSDTLHLCDKCFGNGASTRA